MSPNTAAAVRQDASTAEALPWSEAPARAVAQALREGRLDAGNLAERTLARITSAEPGLQAFAACLTPEAARDQAEALVARGPLAGLPIAVKDIFETADLPTAWGSPIHAPGRAAARDAAVVALLRSAGGLVIGKSATTEFAFLHPAATRNPVAPGRTPGGSSAGSAAAVAAGLVPLAVGTQTGGSVVRPASYCGVVGYKPSFGWLPTAGMSCFSWSIDTVGVFARRVDDAAWFVEVLAGRPLAATELPSNDGRVDERATVVVGVLRSHPWSELSASAQRAMDRAVAALRHDDVTVREVDLPDTVAAAYAAHGVVQGWEASRCLGAEWREHRGALSPELRQELEASGALSDAAYAEAQAVATRARAAFEPWFVGLDALLTPSAPDEPPAGLGSTGTSSFNRLWTLLGGPCVGLPAGTGVNGHPMGVQLVAPHGHDAAVLRVARRLEAALVAGPAGEGGPG